jgi:hypothetical protein
MYILDVDRGRAHTAWIRISRIRHKQAQRCKHVTSKTGHLTFTATEPLELGQFILCSAPQERGAFESKMSERMQDLARKPCTRECRFAGNAGSARHLQSAPAAYAPSEDERWSRGARSLRSSLPGRPWTLPGIAALFTSVVVGTVAPVTATVSTAKTAMILN